MSVWNKKTISRSEIEELTKKDGDEIIKTTKKVNIFKLLLFFIIFENYLILVMNK